MDNKYNKFIYNLLINEKEKKYPELGISQRCIAFSGNMQFFSSVVRSLVRDKENTVIDYTRLEEEKNIMNYYLNSKSDSKTVMGIVPVICSNTDIATALRETIKFLNKESHLTPEMIMMAYIIYYYINNEDIIMCVKESLIGFSLSEFLNEDIPKKEIIDFEKRRVQLLMNFEEAVKKIIKHEAFCDKLIYPENNEFILLIKRYIDYMINIKNGKIKQTPIYTVTKFFNMKRGERFKHHLFGDSIILESISNDTGKTVIIDTVFGTFRFKG